MCLLSFVSVVLRWLIYSTILHLLKYTSRSVWKHFQDTIINTFILRMDESPFLFIIHYDSKLHWSLWHFSAHCFGFLAALLFWFIPTALTKLFFNSFLQKMRGTMDWEWQWVSGEHKRTFIILFFFMGTERAKRRMRVTQLLISWVKNTVKLHISVLFKSKVNSRQLIFWHFLNICTLTK